MVGRSLDFDVIVVGGGPAGAATAINCSRNGLKTLLLERSHLRDRPGETLHPGIEPLFHSLGVDKLVNEAGFLRHPSYLIRSNGRCSIHRYGSDNRGVWLGYQAIRTELQNILLNQASAVGVVISRSERAIRPVVRNSSVSGVLTSASVRTAHFVVDATGSAHWLRRHIGLPMLRVSNRLMAHYGWIDSDADLLRNGRVPEFRQWDTSWTWVAPVGRLRYAWVSLDLEPNGGTKSYLPKPVEEFELKSRKLASDVTWRIVRPCAGSGFFLVGDAASTLDPASSHGVFAAILSGILAAEAISKSLSDRDLQPELQRTYCKWVEDWFCKDAASLISLYSRSSNPPSWLTAASEALRYILTNPSEWTLNSNRNRA
jgi:flavin-dependent dehydrogenase